MLPYFYPGFRLDRREPRHAPEPPARAVLGAAYHELRRAAEGRGVWAKSVRGGDATFGNIDELIGTCELARIGLGLPPGICVPARHAADGACTCAATCNDAATSSDDAATSNDAATSSDDAATSNDAATSHAAAADAAHAANADQQGLGVCRGFQQLLWWHRRQAQWTG